MPRTEYETVEVSGDGSKRRVLVEEWDCGCGGDYHGTCGDIRHVRYLESNELAMTTPAADDFAEIARRLREIEAESKGEQPKPAETPQVSPAEQEQIYDDAGVFW